MSEKIDFTTFSRSAFGASGTTHVPPTLVVSAPNNGLFVVLWGFLDAWGYDGETLGWDMNTPSGLTQVFHQHPYISGGNQIPRGASGAAIYSGAVAGNSYSFTVSQFGRVGSDPKPFWITAFWVPGS